MSSTPDNPTNTKIQVVTTIKTKVLVATVIGIVVFLGGFFAVTEYKIREAKNPMPLFRFPIEEHLSSEAVRSVIGRIKESNRRLERMNGQYKNAAQKQKAKLLSQMAKLAEGRGKLMRILIANDPREVNEVALAFHRSEFPPGVRHFLEEPFETEGFLEVWHGDYFEKRTSQNMYVLNFDGKQLFVFSHAVPHDLISGVKVNTSGIKMDSYLAAMTLNTIKIEPTLFLRDVEERLAVIILQYRNTPGSETFPNALEEINRKVFGDGPGDLTGFYGDDSYGRVRLSGTTLWIQLPEDWEHYFNSGMTVDEFRQIVVDAADSYLDWPQYSRIIVLEHLDPTCTGGMSSIGKVDLQSAEGPFRASFAELYSMECVGRLTTPRLYLAHELGHGFGMEHAGTWDCDEIVGENLETPEENCIIDEYGDNWDTMGRSVQHTSTFHKEKIGWLSSNQSVVAVNGEVYSITENEIINGTLKQVKIPLENGWYSLEYRRKQPIPELEYEGFRGVLLRYIPSEVILAPGGGVDTLRPIDPITGRGLVLESDGNLFYDRFRNIYVQVLRTTEDHAVVYVGSTPPLLPDLRVYDLAFESVTDTTIRAIARVINNTCGPLPPPYICPTSEIGPVDGAFSIKFQRIMADGTMVDDGSFTSPNLEPGAMTDIVGPVYELGDFPEGVTMQIEIDSGSAIAESREDNNVFTASQPKPDLIISQPIESAMLADGSRTLSATTKNTGTFPVTDTFIVKFYSVFGSDMVEIEAQSIEGLRINEEAEIQSRVINPEEQRGVSRYVVTVDPDNLIGELNEENNSRQLPELSGPPLEIGGSGIF